jgi:hypothetical protein
MTPAVASLLRKTVEERLAVIQSEERELRAALNELDGKVSSPIQVETNAAGPTTETSPPKEQSPLETRLQQLREEHGTVFVIQPSGEVAVGQKIPWHKGKQQVTVEIIDRATEAGPSGNVVQGGWYAKCLDL